MSLHRSAALGDSIALRELLASGIGVDELDESGSSALHWACANGRHECVEVLLSVHADPLLRNKNGETPIHVARTVRSSLCLDLLAAALVAGPPVLLATASDKPVNVSAANESLLQGVLVRSSLAIILCFDVHKSRDQVLWSDLHFKVVQIQMSSFHPTVRRCSI